LELGLSRIFRSKKVKQLLIGGKEFMKKTSALFSFIIIAVLVIGCSSNDENNDQTNNSEEDSMTLKLGYMPNYGGLNAVVPAIEKGYFEEEGLDIELVEFSDGPTVVSALESGSIDAGYIGPEPHKLVMEGEAKVAVFSHLGKSDELIGNKANGVSSPEDLKGKKIAVSTGTASETLLKLTMEDAGISEDDVTLTDMDASAIVTAMTSGSVDAVSTWSPGTNTIMEQLGDDAVLLSDNSTYKDVAPAIGSWVVKPDFPDENEDKLKKFVKGFYKGMDYRDGNEEEVAEWIAKVTAEDKDVVMNEIDTGEWINSDELIEMLEDGSMEGYYEALEDLFIEQDKLDEGNSEDIEDIVLFDLMKEAKD